MLYFNQDLSVMSALGLFLFLKKGIPKESLKLQYSVLQSNYIFYEFKISIYILYESAVQYINLKNSNLNLIRGEK